MPADPTPESNPPPSISLDPDLEKLFGLGTPDWMDRLRIAQSKQPLGNLGPYELLEEVGRGGQGEVYRARQPGTGRIVAIKRVAGLGLRPDPVLLARFTREVEALTRLSHPNVVTVHTLDTVDHHTILVMEFVAGRHIDRWADAQWASAQSPPTSILACFAKACDGVAHAHQRGVIHRDIKPSNILVTDSDQPKVLDFGIARLLGDQGALHPQSVFTITGFAGTPAYASPEQLTPGGGIDTRSDVYALGVLLYRVLTGREAFEGPVATTARLKAEGPVPAPRRVRRSLPEECDWIARKATDPEAARRYPTVEAFAEDIRRLLDGRAVIAHPPSALYVARRAICRRPLLSAGIAAAAAAVSVLAIVAAVQAARLSIRSRELADALAIANEQKARAERGEARQRELGERVIEAVGGSVQDFRIYASTETSPIEALTSLVRQLTPEDDPDTVVELRMRLGIALADAGRRAEAEAQLAQAIAVSEQLDDPSGERAARLAVRRAHNLRLSNKHAEGLAIVDRAIERASRGPRSLFVAAMMWERASLLYMLHRPLEEILACIDEWIARCDEHANQARWRSSAREEAAYIFLGLGEYKRAELRLAEAIDICSGGRVPAHEVSRVKHAYACALARECRWAEIEPISRAASAFRISSESALTHRAHHYIRLHATSLLGLGRFEEAVQRWELALARPLSRADPKDTELAVVRTGLAAAHFGLGQDDRARSILALALSKGRTDRPDDPEIAPLLSRAEAALRANNWAIDVKLQSALGESAWLINGLVLSDQPTGWVPGRRTDPSPAQR